MEKYAKAQMEVIEFEAEDVITTSGCNGMDPSLHLFFIFISNYTLFRKTQGVLPCVHHCFRYSLGLIPSTFRNIRLK